MLWIISTLVFLLLRIAPGDPVDAILGNRANELAKEALRIKLGLNISLWEQYIKFLTNLIHGDLGKALINQESVREIISKTLPATIELSLISLFIAIIIGIFVGLSGIAKPEGKIDLIGRVYGISTYALPPFWAAMMVQIFFAVVLGWLPVGGRFPPNLVQPEGSGFLLFDSIKTLDFTSLIGSFRHLILPASTLGILLSGVFSRALRLNLIQVLSSDYVEAARSRGIKESQIILKHALPNVLLPVLTIAGITIASLIGGALLIEVTFSWPGIALRLQEAINQRDYPVVQGIVVVIASLVVLIGLFVDLIVATIDPRIRY
tara:strand:+ start:280 stop:1239 length:960 start_codon:yes stop_codon:yes gene_type:complete